MLSMMLVFCILTLPACAAPADQVIRLHVIADSDKPEAQAVKLEVRDAVLSAAQRLLVRCNDAEDAWRVLNDSLPGFLEAASDCLSGLGCDAEVSVQAGVFEFPDREYEGVTLPAGDYRALRVIIGSGEGKNWWCVLFPNLCLPDGDGYDSVILEWLKNCFGGESA